MAACFCAQAAAADRPDPQQSLAAARNYLLAALPEDVGPCKGEVEKSNPRFAGKTALACYALLAAGEKVQPNQPLANGLTWLARQELAGTYAVSLRICALAAADAEKYGKRIEADAKWLLAAGDELGRYTYTKQPQTPVRYDNSNTQMAVLGLDKAAAAGVDIPDSWWRRAETHFRAQQQADGGWGYWIPPGRVRTQSYGSMTAAALSSLHAAWLVLHEEDFTAARMPDTSDAVTRGLEWMDRNWDPRQNPGKVVEWYYYWLWSSQRVAEATGRKRFGQSDWYASAAGHLASLQQADGGFGYGDKVPETALALLFLAHGSRQVGLAKLQWPGAWNSRPRDAAQWTAFLNDSFEFRTRWQVVSVDDPPEDFLEAPVLYISGAGPIRLEDAQLDKLRRFVRAGGTIVSEAAANNGDFTLDIQRIYKRMCPEMAWRRIGPDEAVYNAQYKLGDAGLWGLHNGVRYVAIHSPRQLSLALHRGDRRGQRETFSLLANLFLYATGLDAPRPLSLGRARPFDAAHPPSATIRVARVKFEGNWDPEPAAWNRLADLLAVADRVRLQVAAVDPGELKPGTHDLAVLTGVGQLDLSDKQLGAIGDYLRAGGTLLVDAAGGDETFVEQVRGKILPLLATGRHVRPEGTDAIFARAAGAEGKVRYRRSPAAAASRPLLAEPRLVGVEIQGRTAIWFSTEDLTAGLVGAQALSIRGYQPLVARQIARNILYRTAQVGR